MGTIGATPAAEASVTLKTRHAHLRNSIPYRRHRADVSCVSRNTQSNGTRREVNQRCIWLCHNAEKVD